MSVKCEENVLNKKGKYDMGTILCLVVLLNTPCASCLSRFILEVAKQDIGDVKQRLVNIGLVYVFKVTDEFYVFESNDGAKLADTIKHAAKGKVKNIYEDTSMFPEAGEDAGTAAGDDDRWGMPKSDFEQCPPFFDTAQQIDMTWEDGFTGRNVTIGVIDIGIDVDNPDLQENINVGLSYNFVDNNPNPKPDFFHDYPESLPFTNHGNACAGVIAGIRSNNNCTVCGCGVAYHTNIAALKAGRIRMYHWDRYPDMTSSSFSAALGHKNQDIHIYSNSWNFAKPFTRLEPFTERVIWKGIEQGRGGLGSVYVFPAGYPGDGFANHLQTIAVNNIGVNGRVPENAVKSSATLVSAFGQGRTRSDTGMLTVTHTSRRRDGRNCSNTFGGPSAATAIISGIIALSLQANPQLTLRDIQHLLVESAGYIGLAESSGFKKNCAGRYFHNVFGFGYVQTLKMVHLAKTWKPLLPLLTQSRISFDVTQSGNDSSPEVISTFNNICTNQPHCIENIEKVVVHINFVYPKHTRSILSVISPCGTESILLDHIGEPPEDESDFGKNEGVNIDASFLSNHFWGENVNGSWLVTLTGLGCDSHELCSIYQTELIFYGTNENVVKDDSSTQTSATVSDINTSVAVTTGSKSHHSNVGVIIVVVVVGAFA
ncbi:neuroendocrine convertase 2-like [Mya arenaria]|uniref:neuroendocrine convertase 2-like n=1 Tax=Mya arenaria TaxID=6604 RepID=UPI0022E73073|nr:neuroendocrine convertase 2-like [Mya arenaria]